MAGAPRHGISPADVEAAIRELAAAQFELPLDGIDLDMPIADAPDSLGLSIVVAALEQRFNVVIGDRDVARARTLRDLAHLVAARRMASPGNRGG